MKAYVLLNTELGREASVMDALSSVLEIKGMHSLYGVYDIIVEVEAESMDKVKEIVFNKIRRLDDVKNTITLLTYGESVINE
jgi:DNA-binding Lrp family transcriptional regulator